MLAAGVVNQNKRTCGPQKNGTVGANEVCLPTVSCPSKAGVPVFNLEHPPQVPSVNTGFPGGGATWKAEPGWRKWVPRGGT